MELHLWESSGGRSYVQGFIQGLKDEKAKPKITEKIKLLRDWDYQRLFLSQDVKKIKGSGRKLHEFIISIRKVEYRIMFIIRNSTCYLLSGFIKKDQRTRLKEIRLAEDRAREVDLYLGKQ